MERRRDQAQRDRATIAQMTNNSQNDFFPPPESLFKPPSKVCNFIDTLCPQNVGGMVGGVRLCVLKKLKFKMFS